MINMTMAKKITGITDELELEFYLKAIQLKIERVIDKKLIPEDLGEDIQLFIFDKIIESGTTIDGAGLKSYSIKDISYSFITSLDKNESFVKEVASLFGCGICL